MSSMLFCFLKTIKVITGGADLVKTTEVDVIKE